MVSILENQGGREGRRFPPEAGFSAVLTDVPSYTALVPGRLSRPRPPQTLSVPAVLRGDGAGLPRCASRLAAAVLGTSLPPQVALYLLSPAKAASSASQHGTIWSIRQKEL